jgi:transposase InsO family protein
LLKRHWKSIFSEVPCKKSKLDARAKVGLAGKRRRYGYRRVTAELRRRGMVVNHKRVAQMMREDNLLAIEPRAFMVTTDSDHEREVDLHTARGMKRTRVNQQCPISPTSREFVYLAVILDADSRKVVGWALEGSLGAGLARAA